MGKALIQLNWDFRTIINIIEYNAKLQYRFKTNLHVDDWVNWLVKVNMPVNPLKHFYMKFFNHEVQQIMPESLTQITINVINST